MICSKSPHNIKRLTHTRLGGETKDVGPGSVCGRLAANTGFAAKQAQYRIALAIQLIRREMEAKPRKAHNTALPV